MAQILSFEQTAHARCDRLLPWYVNGTLEPTERGEVEAHLASCDRCSAEFRRAQEFARTLQATDVDPDCDRALEHLLDRVENRARPRTFAHRGRFLSAWRNPAALRGLAVAQALVLALAVGWIVRPVADAPYRTLSSETQGPGARAIVGFDSARPEKEIRAVLLAAGVRVVDGPTREGLYVVETAPSGLPAAVAFLERQQAVTSVISADPR